MLDDGLCGSESSQPAGDHVLGSGLHVPIVLCAVESGDAEGYLFIVGDGDASDAFCVRVMV